MAGLPHFRMANDPAILKMGTMSTNRYKYFRWTKRSARLTIVYGLVMPSLFAFVAYKTDVRPRPDSSQPEPAVPHFYINLN
ncbi:NADH:ubiquinone oxidoreductase 6.6kD subunit [Hypoxylon argillaceum]|nr:NADH:ubiquinone oxidoreductase 6.6kD subunit [Hypoxylon argillaceum]